MQKNQTLLPDAHKSRTENTKSNISDSIEELEGNMKKSGTKENKLMNSVDQSADEENNGKLAEDYINNSIGSFTPDIVFQNLVNNYKNAKKLYGETIIRELTDFEPGYIEKNVNIPEFKTQLKKNIAAKTKDLKNQGILNSQFVLTNEGFDLAAVNICESELDKLKIKGFGNKKSNEFDIYGEKDSYDNYKKGTRYKDISIAQTIKNAARRNHNSIKLNDIKTYTRKKVGKVDIIYCLDSSGSMKGDKIGLCKRAGVALSYKAILESNRVGLLVFDSEIRKTINLTKDFNLLLSELVKIRASNQTNIKEVISTATEMLSKSNNTKHIVILSDGMSNVGDVEDIYKSAAIANSKKLTISFIGVNLDSKGSDVAEKIVDIGKGRLYKISKLDNVDSIMLEDYAFVKNHS